MSWRERLVAWATMPALTTPALTDSTIVQRKEIVMPQSVEQFFAGYVVAFNRSLQGEVDIAGIRAHFSPCFVAAGPGGVNCGQNDESFSDTLRQGYAFYASIGTKAMAVRGIATTPIDEGHQMARVEYRATYEKPGGETLDLDFAVTYLLAARDETYEIFAFVAGDEMALYRKHGLLPADSS